MPRYKSLRERVQWRRNWQRRLGPGPYLGPSSGTWATAKGPGGLAHPAAMAAGGAVLTPPAAPEAPWFRPGGGAIRRSAGNVLVGEALGAGGIPQAPYQGLMAQRREAGIAGAWERRGRRVVNQQVLDRPWSKPTIPAGMAPFDPLRTASTVMASGIGTGPGGPGFPGRKGNAAGPLDLASYRTPPDKGPQVRATRAAMEAERMKVRTSAHDAGWAQISDNIQAQQMQQKWANINASWSPERLAADREADKVMKTVKSVFTETPEKKVRRRADPYSLERNFPLNRMRLHRNVEGPGGQLNALLTGADPMPAPRSVYGPPGKGRGPDTPVLSTARQASMIGGMKRSAGAIKGALDGWSSKALGATAWMAGERSGRWVETAIGGGELVDPKMIGPLRQGDARGVATTMTEREMSKKFGVLASQGETAVVPRRGLLTDPSPLPYGVQEPLNDTLTMKYVPGTAKHNRWGAGLNPERFFGRGAMGHMGRIGHNIRRDMGLFTLGATGGLGWGGLAFGALMYGSVLGESSDNVLSPTEGVARGLARATGGVVGFDIGMGFGAAASMVAAPLLGPLAPVIGTIVGGLGGTMLGEMAADMPWGLAEMGREATIPFNTPFLDSARAQTMRQRSMEMIYRSQMNARSALSMEAHAYHM